MNDHSIIFSMEGIQHTYCQANTPLPILKDVSFQLKKGEVVALMGASGSGKSTLLHIAGLLEPAEKGQVIIQGRLCGLLSDKERTIMRRKILGFVYQFHHLLPEFSALENIMLPQMIAGVSRAQAFKKALILLDHVGLSHRMDHRPGRLSGGEQQRVAIARALANNPEILIADEPTGNLDERTGEEIFDLLQELSSMKNLTVLMATHNETLAKKTDKILRLWEGRLNFS